METTAKQLKRNQYMREYYHRNKTNTKFMEDRRVSRAKEKEKNREKNRIASMEYIRQWRKEHYATDKQRKAECRARKYGVPMENVDYQKLFEAWDKVCGICEEVVDGAFDFDHIYPLVRGGGHVQGNIQLTHRHCNRVKWAKVLI